MFTVGFFMQWACLRIRRKLHKCISAYGTNFVKITKLINRKATNYFSKKRQLFPRLRKLPRLIDGRRRVICQSDKVNFRKNSSIHCSHACAIDDALNLNVPSLNKCVDWLLMITRQFKFCVRNDNERNTSQSRFTLG